jgi:site-specific recombinase XerD
MNELTITPPHYAIIDASTLGELTKVKYKSAVDRLIAAGVDPRNTDQLKAYAAALPHSSRSHLKSALRLLYAETENRLKAGANRDNLADVQAAILNMDAMREAITVPGYKGKRVAIWLSPEQVEQITALPDRSTARGRRDWIILALLLGAGLRRAEMAALTFTAVKRQPMKNGQPRGVLEILGKGKKYRTVPINSLLESRLEEWRKEAGDGYIARAVNKTGTINGSLSETAINAIVHRYGAMIGLPELEAHDLRRTWAQLGLNAGVPLQEISTLLGHGSLVVTQRYLDLQISLENTISDYIPLR